MGSKLRFCKGGQKECKSEVKSPETGQNFKTSYVGLGMAELRILKGKNHLLAISFQPKKNWANPTFLWAANCNSAKVVKKSVKSEAKSPETGQNFKNSYLRLEMTELKTLKAKITHLP